MPRRRGGVISGRRSARGKGGDERFVLREPQEHPGRGVGLRGRTDDRKADGAPLAIGRRLRVSEDLARATANMAIDDARQSRLDVLIAAGRFP